MKRKIKTAEEFIKVFGQNRGKEPWFDHVAFKAIYPPEKLLYCKRIRNGKRRRPNN